MSLSAAASQRKIRATKISMATATALAVMKLLVGALSGSLAVLASAIDSLLDIGMSLVNYLAVRQAEQPADENHPFGHGKFETLATLFQAAVISLSGGLILFEAVRRLLAGTSLQALDSGMAVLLISAGASWGVTRHLRAVARETDSSALEADALHYAMDVYTNLGLCGGLLAIRLSGATWVDPALSLLVGLYIIKEAIDLLRHGLRDVLDAELPPQIREEVERLINAHSHQLLGFHNLRTRRAGSQKIMDFHLTVCKDLTVKEAHDIADHLEKRIQQRIKGADVTIHIEPCDREDCPGRALCPVDKARPEDTRPG